MRRPTQDLKKQRYLVWFLQQFKLKVPSAERLISYLIKTPELLSIIRLVEDIRYRPNGLLISAVGADTYPFVCRIHDQHYSDPDEIIVKLSMDPPDELMLWLSFDRSMVCATCLDNFFSEGNELQRMIALSQQLQEIAFDYTMKLQVKQAKTLELVNRINEALDLGNKELFQQLSTEYAQLIQD